MLSQLYVSLRVSAILTHHLPIATQTQSIDAVIYRLTDSLFLDVKLLSHLLLFQTHCAFHTRCHGPNITLTFWCG